MNDFQPNSNKFFVICYAVFSILSLIFSFIHEYFEKQVPCDLCIYQRLALFGIVSGSLLWMFSDFKRISNVLLKTSLLGCFILAAWHFSTQMGWIPDFCYVPKNVKNLDEFSKLIEESQKSSCSKVTWKFIGIPASTYNVIFSFIFLISPYFCQKKSKRPVQKIESFSPLN